MGMLADTRVAVKVCIGIQDVTIWEGKPPEKAIIVAARISATEITLFTGPEEEPEEEMTFAPGPKFTAAIAELDRVGEEGES